jgi:hypothetical protein
MGKGICHRGRACGRRLGLRPIRFAKTGGLLRGRACSICSCSAQAGLFSGGCCCLAENEWRNQAISHLRDRAGSKSGPSRLDATGRERFGQSAVWRRNKINANVSFPKISAQGLKRCFLFRHHRYVRILRPQAPTPGSLLLMVERDPGLRDPR